MEHELYFSFDDEPVNKFCYSINEKKIEVHYNGYYDLRSDGSFIEKRCTYIIEDWIDAKSKMGDEQKLYDLNKNMGVFSMILFMELKGDKLEMLVNTLDNRYITLLFVRPKVTLKFS